MAGAAENVEGKSLVDVNQDQKDFWSSEAGDKWVRHQRDMDALLEPVLQLILKHADLKTGESVLDVGCGTGTSTVAAAQLVGETGHCTGVDIADTLLNHAAQHFDRRNIDWVLADAQTNTLKNKKYDVMISRFGVMFFANTVAAFKNIKSALKPNGRVIMAAWGPAPDNPWFMLPAKAAKMQLGQMPKTDRSQPGPFAFENHTDVMEMFDVAGFGDIQTTTHNLGLTATNGLKATAQLCCEIGPADSILRHFDGTAADRAVIETTRAMTRRECRSGITAK